ncbi:MAG: DUF1987 domain-containing protein [Bacteroidales bacterium]|jgi:hypothetical protein|nr:DUF1987 domain-containing protein [Bacteroidales bacterium]
MDKIIPSTAKTPEINIDKISGTVVIKGILIPENPYEYFNGINPFITEVYNCNNKLALNIDLDYFNTGAAKYLYDLLKNFTGKPNVDVIWHYEEDDEDILESGHEYETLTGLKFIYKIK